MDVRYVIGRKEIVKSGENKTYCLVGVEANESYKNGSVAPTMGAAHLHAEFKTIWSDNKCASFERLTAINYLKILFEEFRWEEREPFTVFIVPEIDIKNKKRKKSRKYAEKISGCLFCMAQKGMPRVEVGESCDVYKDEKTPNVFQFGI